MKAVRLVTAAGLLMCSSLGVSSVPVHDPYFKPSIQTVNGPAELQFSGFCVKLLAGEVAERNQMAPWSSSTSAELKQGQLTVGETSAGYSTGVGKPFRKVVGGWLRMKSEGGKTFYYYDTVMPGSTVISFRTKHGSQKLNTVLKRLTFGPTCNMATK